MAEMWDVLDEHGNKKGYTVQRGSPMDSSEYHLAVHVWIMNSKGEFLISKRTPNKPWGNLWETTAGSAVAGDESLTTAIKEVREELGLLLNSVNGHHFKRYRRECDAELPNYFVDVWFFKHDFDIKDVVFQPGETCDAKWASKDVILQMMDDGSFIPKHIWPYIDELFSFASKQITN